MNEVARPVMGTIFLVVEWYKAEVIDDTLCGCKFVLRFRRESTLPSKKSCKILLKKKCKIMQELTSKKMHKIETVIIQDLTLIFTGRSCNSMHDLKYNMMQNYSRLYKILA